ncbi:MAG: RbsD/FucU domain-containing protein [Calditrichaceae bacterium]
MSPDLLSNLYRMGHGDEIILADAHFPGESLNRNIIRAGGIRIPDLLNAILPLITFDTYVDSPLTMMAAVKGDILDPNVENL